MSAAKMDTHTQQRNGRIVLLNCRQRLLDVLGITVLMNLANNWTLTFRALHTGCIAPVFSCLWCHSEIRMELCLLEHIATSLDVNDLITPLIHHYQICQNGIRILHESTLDAIVSSDEWTLQPIPISNIATYEQATSTEATTHRSDPTTNDASASHLAVELVYTYEQCVSIWNETLPTDILNYGNVQDNAETPSSSTDTS